MANLTNAEMDLFSQVKAQLESYGLGELASTLINIIQEYGDDMPETINAELRKTPVYQQRFAGNQARVKAGLPTLSEAEYINNERQYREILRSYGQADLATSANYADFIAKDISPVELTSRFGMAVERVQKADPALKRQLNKMYPGISDNDLARSLLMGKEGAQFLDRKIGQAEILAEADIAGISLQTSAADLQGQGVNRDIARKGLQATSQALGGTTQAASRYGDTRSAQQIQKEMESENLLGVRSKKNTGLASQARAEFRKSSGIGRTSLGKNPKAKL